MRNFVSTPRAIRATVAALALSLGSGAVTPLMAQGTASTTFQVLANVTGVCAVSATDINFGTYDPIVTHQATPNDALGQIGVSCTTGVVAAVALDLGVNANGSTRRMAGSGGGFLTYEIYSDSNHADIWGSGANEVVLPVSTSINERVFTTFGRMPAAQDVPEGTYVDTITVTVTY